MRMLLHKILQTFHCCTTVFFATVCCFFATVYFCNSLLFCLSTENIYAFHVYIFAERCVRCIYFCNQVSFLNIMYFGILCPEIGNITFKIYNPSKVPPWLGGWLLIMPSQGILRNIIQINQNQMWPTLQGFPEFKTDSREASDPKWLITKKTWGTRYTSSDILCSTSQNYIPQ